MEYSLFACLFFGLLSGFSEFLPVSTLAHQYLYSYLTGFDGKDPYLCLMVYLGCLIAVLVSCRKRLVHIYRELRIASLPKRRRRRVPDMQAVSDFKLATVSLIPIVLGVFFYNPSVNFFSNLPFIAVMLILSGILVYLPQYMVTGFHTSQDLTRLDGLLLGLCSALAVIPGLSRMGLLVYAGRIRRCGRESIFNLALLLAIPMLLALAVLQLILLLSGGGIVMTGNVAIAGAVTALAAFGGTFAAVYFMRYLAVKVGFSGFSYYCWGLTVFCLIYYLIT